MQVPDKVNKAVEAARPSKPLPVLTQVNISVYSAVAALIPHLCIHAVFLLLGFGVLELEAYDRDEWNDSIDRLPLLVALLRLLS